MGKPTGFKEFERESEPYRDPVERLVDFKEKVIPADSLAVLARAVAELPREERGTSALITCLALLLEKKGDLARAEPLLERQIHPTVICNGYLKALDDAVKWLDELATPLDLAGWAWRRGATGVVLTVVNPALLASLRLSATALLEQPRARRSFS